MSKSRKAVVPPLPQGYRDGALPELPLRNTLIHIAPADPCADVPKGIQPASLTVEKRPDGTEHGTISDRQVAELMLYEAHMRDQFADAACIEILAAMSGDEMTPELCHGLRMRLRKLADDIHALARVGAAHIGQREWSRKRSKSDAAEIVRRVKAKVASGTTVTDSLLEVADEMGRPETSIRKQYFKHRNSLKT